MASLGLYKGVAQVYGVKLKGLPAWFMHRTYHVSRVPTFNRKARVVADWTLACCSAARSSPSASCRTRAGSSCSPPTPAGPATSRRPAADQAAALPQTGS